MATSSYNGHFHLFPIWALKCNLNLTIEYQALNVFKRYIKSSKNLEICCLAVWLITEKSYLKDHMQDVSVIWGELDSEYEPYLPMITHKSFRHAVTWVNLVGAAFRLYSFEKMS